MKNKLFLVSFVIIIGFESALVQGLIGSYTIGGSSSDYQTIMHNSFDSNDEVFFSSFKLWELYRDEE